MFRQRSPHRPAVHRITFSPGATRLVTAASIAPVPLLVSTYTAAASGTHIASPGLPRPEFLGFRTAVITHRQGQLQKHLFRHRRRTRSGTNAFHPYPPRRTRMRTGCCTNTGWKLQRCLPRAGAARLYAASQGLPTRPMIPWGSSGLPRLGAATPIALLLGGLDCPASFQAPVSDAGEQSGRIESGRIGRRGGVIENP
jgi:hypothetical protein